ncbi:hypothetical protein [Roseiconus lacunae]|uniref:Resolvase HTH domain-containing protein n=1 Tax=Roseiconus lacunae TaxID=2605694 RepID=A0ABT7PH81_9BACT|nr:hypothetical protein [Roseiconus lacunae]MDM4015867.1 hypothetical protein [Roseiconus lacunae]
MHREVVRRLRQGRRIREVAVEFRVPYSVVQRIAAESGVKYCGRQLDRSQEAEIRRRREIDGQSIRTIAREMGLPKSKVGRFSRRVYLDVIADDDDVGFEDTTQTRRCPVHGLVTVWPCVACAATRRS